MPEEIRTPDPQIRSLLPCVRENLVIARDPKCLVSRNVWSNVMITSKHDLPPPMHAPCHLGRPQKLQRNQRASLHGLLLHNHPSGDPTPSRADIDMTRAIVEVARPLGIAVHDHLIVGKDGHASLKALKLM